MMHPQGVEPQTHASLVPPGALWPALVRTTPTDRLAQASRRALGLPTDRPILMGGHQPGLWHMGILAKWLAIEALAEHTGAAPAWIVVDQSPGAGAEFAYPAADAHVLRRGSIRLGAPENPPAAQPPANPINPADPATPQIARALERFQELLERHARKPSLARQLHAACLEALAPMYPPTTIFATDLAATPAFASLTRAMRDDPRACARLYNEAAAAQPGAAVRELLVSPAAVELPLWERTSTPEHPGPWRSVTSDRLADLPDDRLAPRGLPMTGLLRRWLCDLFIHGSGGGATGGDVGYDRVTERWFDAWLGDHTLAPAVVATATMRLRFDEFQPPTPEEIAQAQAAAHRALHDPALLGDISLGERKRRLAEHIAALPRASEERAALFKQLHALRTDAAHDHAEQLQTLRHRADELAARADEADVAADRTWSFLFHGEHAVAALRATIRDAMRHTI